MQKTSLADQRNVKHCEPEGVGIAAGAGGTPSLYCYLQYEFSWVETWQDF